MDAVEKKVRKLLNSFVGSNRISSYVLVAQNFQQSYEFPVSGRTVYRIIKERKKPSTNTSEAILEHFEIPFKRTLNKIELLENGKEETTNTETNY